MPKKFNGNSSKNARIKIDYRDKNPKVNFSYPSKKHQKEFSMLPVICCYWWIICGFFFFIFALSTGQLMTNELDLKNHTQYITHFEEYKYERCEEISMEFKDQFNNAIKDVKEGFNLKLLLLLLIFTIPPPLIYFPFKKKWQDYFPKYQGKKVKKKLVIFKPKDIRKDEKGYFVEIPLFNNIILNYKATKNSEFSKYLDLVEIREHNFKYVVSKRLEGDEKKRKELNDFIWYARFSFSNKPTTGQLKVLFK